MRAQRWKLSCASHGCARCGRGPCLLWPCCVRVSAADAPPPPSASGVLRGVCGSSASQKWSKGKVKEKLANLVLFDKATYDKMLADVPKQKLITPSIISEKLKVNGSLARKAVKELLSKNLIRAPLHRDAARPGMPCCPGAEAA